MRCTRCDGLAIPQAVGIAPDGRVVFGWCLQCLADKQCRLVEVSAAGPWKLELSFSTTKPAGLRTIGNGDHGQAMGADQSQWIIAVVAFLMISWGLILLIAGLFSGNRSPATPSPMGNGTAPLLGVGGTATALLGLVLLIHASRQNRLPGTFLLALLSWLALLAGCGILAYGLVDLQPGRKVPLALGSGIALGISAVTRWLARSARRKLNPTPLVIPWKPSSSTGKRSARQTKRPY